MTKLFFELSHQGRYDIFKQLCEKRKRHSQLLKDLTITGPEITRHLKRLTEQNLVKKFEDNTYGITNLGDFFSRVLDFFEITLKHVDFFNTHDFTTIPLHLMVQMGELKTVETSKKTMANIELWSDLVKNSEKFILAITDQFQHSLLPIVERKIKQQSLEIRALIDKTILKSYRFPSGMSKLVDNPEEFYKNVKRFKNVRILEQINFSLVVSDMGAILFLRKGDEIDYSQCLIDNHPNYIEWAKQLFEWYWNKGKVLKP